MHVGFREHVTGCFVEQYGVDTITVNILCPLCEFYFFFFTSSAKKFRWCYRNSFTEYAAFSRKISLLTNIETIAGFANLSFGSYCVEF